MKKLTIAATILAVSASFSAPSFAMDNAVAESRAKIQRALHGQKFKSFDHRQRSVRTTTFGEQKSFNPRRLTARQNRDAKRNFFGYRFGPIDR